jgi:hypothetical protein
MHVAEFRRRLWAVLQRPVWQGRLITRRRCWAVLAFAACALLMLGGLLFLLWPREDPMKLAYERVQIGMTPAEVDAIFGRPADDFRLDDDGFWRAEGEVDPDRKDVRSWKGEGGRCAWVVFRHDRVAGKDWYRPPVRTLDQLRRWFPFLNFK